MFSYFTGQPDQNLEEIEAAAQILVDQDPIAAAVQYERLADESRRISDKEPIFLKLLHFVTRLEIDKTKSILTLLQLQQLLTSNFKQRSACVMPVSA